MVSEINYSFISLAQEEELHQKLKMRLNSHLDLIMLNDADEGKLIEKSDQINQIQIK